MLNLILLTVDLNEAEWFFLIVFMIEIILRIYAIGPREFIKRYWNMYVISVFIFDCVGRYSFLIETLTNIALIHLL